MHCMMGARKLNMILLSNVGNTHSKGFSLIILWWRFIRGTKEHCGGSTASVLTQANDSSHYCVVSSQRRSGCWRRDQLAMGHRRCLRYKKMWKRNDMTLL